MTLLWSPHSLGEWFVSAAAQTVVGFAVIVVVLTPVWGRVRRFYESQTDPFTVGGAGDRVMADGRTVRTVLKDEGGEH